MILLRCLRLLFRMSSTSFYQNLPRRHRSQRDFWSGVWLDHDRPGEAVALLDAQGCSWRQSTTVDELKERNVLVENARDFQTNAKRTIGQALQRGRADLALGRWDWIAVRVHAGVVQRRVHFCQDFVADGMFEFLGFGVNFAPVQAQHFHQEKFDEAMSAQNVQGELLAAARQARAAARFVFDEPGFSERFDHAGGRTGDDVHGGGELAHRHQLIRRVLLLEVELLQVVLDGDAGHLFHIIRLADNCISSTSR